jgi:2-keto-4-pentenoate hydratase/2-oxohepta-3-ene-1,7-dioic acid hydratase in catechol pathway
MKLVTFATRQATGPVLRAGVQIDRWIIDVDLAVIASGGSPLAGESLEPFSDSELLNLIRAGERGLEVAREATQQALENGNERLGDGVIVHAESDIQLVSPLPRPNSLRDYMVIEDHLRGVVEAGLMDAIPAEWYRIPAHYKGNVDEIYGPGDTIPWPAYTDKLDYELEICAVIGESGRRIASERAGAHILGYTLYNDWSARDIQQLEMSIGIGPGICKDFASSLGPCIITPDEFDRDNALLQAKVDGELWSTGTIGKMHFSFEEIIEWTSQEETLHVGDLLGSGTVGTGCGLELDRWLTEGCVVELEAEGIGTLRNRVGRKGHGPRRALEDSS